MTVLVLSLAYGALIVPHGIGGAHGGAHAAGTPPLSPPSLLPRLAISGTQSALLAATLSSLLVASTPTPCLALRDMDIGLNIEGYEEVTCPEELRQGRAGGALGAGAGGAGIAQKCVKVNAKASNGSGKVVSDAGVFGVVIGKQDGMSVLGNGQDGKNDAGQFAMIDKIVPGESSVSFLFVAQQSDPCVSTRQAKCPVEGTKPLMDLKFDKVKAISYPGGDRYKVYDECEQNEFAEGC